jgi:lipopolysaccharide transport system ATP-binding protein
LNPVHVHFHEQEALAFEVVETGEGASVRGDYQGQYPGVIRPMLNWTTEYSGEENVRGPVAS